MGLKRQRPACGNDDKGTGNQVSGLRWRFQESTVKPIGCNSVDLKRGFQQGRSSIERGTIAGNARKPGTEEGDDGAGQENGSHGDKPIPRASASQIMQIVSPIKRITLLLFIFRRTGVLFLLYPGAGIGSKYQRESVYTGLRIVRSLICIGFSFLLRDIVLHFSARFAQGGDHRRHAAVLVGKEPGAGFHKGTDTIELVEAYGNVKLAHAGQGVDHPIDVSGEGPSKAAEGHD
jgi:hypothetical protein